MKIRKGDKVKVIAGKDLGKIGLVLRVLTDKDAVVVEGVNIAKKHVKPGAVSKEGGIIKKEAPIHVSNVMYVDADSGKAVRLGKKVVDEKIYRVNKATGKILEK